MDLAQFIDTYKEAIAQRVVESYPPLYRPSENGHKLPQLLRSPLGAQADAIRGVTLSLKSHQGTNIVGEMGTGKTFIGASSAYAAGFERILVLCPPHPDGVLDPKVEAGGGANRSPGPCRHRRLHHRPGAAPPLHRARPTLRHHVQGCVRPT